jgi:hypothetical protein
MPPAIVRATIAASSPTPNRVDDFRVRTKWVPTKTRPSTTVLAPSSWTGKPGPSNASAWGVFVARPR